MSRGFDALVAEAAAVDVAGWDFSWLAGRATEQRPSWGYQRLLGQRLASVRSALDLQTGGGEVLAGVPEFPPLMVATESWRPNLIQAGRRLHPRGATVVGDSGRPPLPFQAAVFELVTSRHPASVWWAEIARVLKPGGSYFAQHVGPNSNQELYEFFLGRQPTAGPSNRHPDVEAAEAQAAGLRIVDLRAERLRVEFYDIGAVIYFLRKVIWTVPDFSVQRYRARLHDLHQLIEGRGSFVSHSSRTLILAEKPSPPRECP